MSVSNSEKKKKNQDLFTYFINEYYDKENALYSHNAFPRILHSMDGGELAIMSPKDCWESTKTKFGKLMAEYKKLFIKRKLLGEVGPSKNSPRDGSLGMTLCAVRSQEGRDGSWNVRMS